ncbi:MAG: hypothetical protein HQL40_18495 [Alphaproteobacteria bacterium]|nr:hypothetical protein [Alphaproteobacteria bacterium]
MEGRGDAPRQQAGGSLHLLLSVYLLLLAFFVLLNSMSSIERDRSKAALDSVSDRFAAAPPPAEAPLVMHPDEIAAAQRLHDVLGQVLRAAVPVARVDVVLPGRLMQATMPALALFQEGAAALRPGRRELVAQLVEALADAPVGLRYECDVLIGVAAPNGDLPTTETLETARAGVFGRAMAASGAKPGLVAVGVEAGDPELVRLLFRVAVGGG